MSETKTRPVYNAVYLDTGEEIYLKTHAKVIYHSDGTNTYNNMLEVLSDIAERDGANIQAVAAGDFIEELEFLTETHMNSIIGDLTLLQNS